MRLVIQSESSHQGKVPDDFYNMRVEFCWANRLDAEMRRFGAVIPQETDLVLVIIPKKVEEWGEGNFVQRVEKQAPNAKVLLLQEGNSNYWQDYPVEKQAQFLNEVDQFDGILCHNKADQCYYEGLFPHLEGKVVPIRSVMRDWVKFPEVERHNVLVGGNMTNWYSGTESIEVAREFGEEIFLPSMGRRQENEHLMQVHHLPYTLHHGWLELLNQFKYVVHLMRTFGAGTMSLNAAYFGIPCIGYAALDTQRLLHPDLSVEQVGDLKTARKMARMLKNDEDFYQECSKKTRFKYDALYHSRYFKEDFFKSIKHLLNNN